MKAINKIKDFLPLALMVLLLGSCAEQELPEEYKGGKVTISVRDISDGATRAQTDGSRRVMFENGDAIGVYVTDGSSILQSNIQVTYDGANWNAATALTFSESYKYFAYYPYTASPSAPAAAAATADAFFAAHITAFTPAADQSTMAGMMSSDLMVSKGTATPVGAGGNIEFTMDHKMGLVLLELFSKSVERQTNKVRYTTPNGYTFTVTEGSAQSGGTTSLDASTTFGTNKPYNFETGKYYYIVKPATATTIEGTGTGAWSVSATVQSGKYVQMAARPSATSMTDNDYVVDKTYTVSVGDLMCDDGSLWHTDGTTAYAKITAANTAGMNIKPIGVVFSTSTSAKDRSSGFKNGYVLSLYSANSGVKVANWSTGDAGTWTNVTGELFDNTTAAAQWTALTGDLDGYTHCARATASFTNFVYDANQTLTAMQAAYENNLMAAAPTANGTSCWYLPSIGQLYVMVKNLCQAEFTTVSGHTYANVFPTTWSDDSWTWRETYHDMYIDNAKYTAASAVIAKDINDFIKSQGLTAVYNNGNTSQTYTLGSFQAFAKADNETPGTAVGDYMYYWSSTERTAIVPFNLYFNSNGRLYLGGDSGDAKASASRQVRSVLAF